MKKILIVMVLFFVIVGCKVENPPTKSDAKTEYIVAASNLKEQKSIDMKMKMSIAVEGNEDYEDMGDIILDIKYLHNDEPTKVKASMNMAMGELAFSYYLSEGMFYIDSFGYKLKQAMDDESIEAFSFKEITTNIIENDSFLKHIKESKDGDNTVLTIELNSHEEIVAVFKEINNETIGDLTTENVEFENLFVEMVINKNSEMVSYILRSSSIEKELNEKSTIEITIDVNAYGSNVKVDIPDLSEYVEQ